MKALPIRALALAACLASALALPGCGGDGTPPVTGVANALIQLTVAPNPIVTVVTSGNTFVVRGTLKVSELNGLGVTFELVDTRLFDDATGLILGSSFYDDKDLLVFIGSKRVEAKGFLEIPQELSYVQTAKRAASLVIRVRVKDDKGNSLEQALLVKVT